MKSQTGILKRQAAKFENATYIGFKVCNDLIVLHIKYKFGRNSPQRLVGRQIASALVPDLNARLE